MNSPGDSGPTPTNSFQALSAAGIGWLAFGGVFYMVGVVVLVANVLIGLPVWGGAGLAWGLWVWQVTEKKYRKVFTTLARSRNGSASE